METFTIIRFSNLKRRLFSVNYLKIMDIPDAIHQTSLTFMSVSV